MRAIVSLLTMSLPTLLCVGVSLPLHAEPPKTAPQHATAEPPHAAHSRIGEVMGSLTQALRDAAEQQSHASATLRSAPSPASRDASTPTSLPPDATAQATVP